MNDKSFRFKDWRWIWDGEEALTREKLLEMMDVSNKKCRSCKLIAELHWNGLLMLLAFLTTKVISIRFIRE